ncbi:MAG: EamA family transporter [Acidobacteria bacterium]|nr:EamA family transporter [Acidobacteriota bacterium]
MRAGLETARPGIVAGAARAHPHRASLYTLIGLMQFFWAANFLIAKIALRELPALLVAGLRMQLAALCILPLYAWKARRECTRRDLPMLLLLGVVGAGINQVFFIWGLSKTSVAHSAIIIGMTPIWVLLLASARGLERITLRKLAGILLALAGVAVLSQERSVGARFGSAPTLAGDLLTLVAGAAFALYTVMGKEVNHRYGSLTVNTFLFGSGALFLTPIVIWQGRSFPFGGVSPAGWLALAYTAVFAALIAYLIFYYALGFVSPTRLSTLSYLQPVAVTLSGVLLLGEQLTAPLVAGGATILAGVYLTQRG